jgi:hypothetical protein
VCVYKLKRIGNTDCFTMKTLGINYKSIYLQLFLLGLILPMLVQAQRFTAQTSHNRVAVGETFQIAFTLNGSGGNFRPPSFKDLDVYSGPNQSSSMSIINGNVSQSITLSYIVAAKKEGKLVIEPATITADGKTLESNPISIEVVKGSNNANAGNNNNTPNNRQSQAQSENLSDNIFIKAHLSKSKAYRGEQVMITYKLYSRYQLVDIRDIKFPDYTGFWTQDIEGSHNIQVTTENVNGTGYYVAEIRKSFLFAQRTGKLELKPIELQCIIRRQSQRAPRDIFEQFFGRGHEDVAVSLKSNAAELNIVPLPEKDKPENYTGAVGNYTFKAHLSKDKVKANDAINLTITVSGKGNLKLIDPIAIDFPDDFETYDPKISEKISTNASGVSGSKTFDYLIIPRHQGEFMIQPSTFSFFDTEKNKYISLPTPEFKIQVEQGEETSATVQGFESKTKEEVKILGNDIRYIKTENVVFNPIGDYFFNSPGFYGALFTPVFAFLGFVFAYRKRIEQNKDVVAVKSRKAALIAKKHLQSADAFMSNNNKEQFYSAVLDALFVYIGDKFNIPKINLNRENISDTLTQKNVKAETIQKLITTIDSCEFAKYAPSGGTDAFAKIYNDAKELIIQIEDESKVA